MEEIFSGRSQIIKLLSLLVCILGIIGPVFAALLLNSMINYGRRFLEDANKLEASIFAETKLNQKEIGFYGAMFTRYEDSLKKKSSVKKSAPIIFGLFSFAWIILLLQAFNVKYVLYTFSLG